MTPVTPEQVLEFSQFPQFRRLVAQLIDQSIDDPRIHHLDRRFGPAQTTAHAIRTMIELKDILET